MLLRALVIAGVVAFGGLAFSIATAEETAAPAAIDGINLNEPNEGIGALTRGLGLRLAFSEPGPERSTHIAADARDLFGDSTHRRFELSATSSAEQTGLPVDVSVAQRAAVRISADGDLRQSGGGTEVRIGRGLARLAESFRSESSWRNPTWYLFAAGDNEQLAWTPGAQGRSSVTYREDRVEIGDMQAGIAVEAMGIQASLAYVERDIRGKYGSAEENFTGVTLTWRR